jgi:hypothetical protein
MGEALIQIGTGGYGVQSRRRWHSRHNSQIVLIIVPQLMYPYLQSRRTPYQPGWQHGRNLQGSVQHQAVRQQCWKGGAVFLHLRISLRCFEESALPWRSGNKVTAYQARKVDYSVNLQSFYTVRMA